MGGIRGSLLRRAQVEAGYSAIIEFDDWFERWWEMIKNAGFAHIDI